MNSICQICRQTVKVNVRDSDYEGFKFSRDYKCICGHQEIEVSYDNSNWARLSDVQGFAEEMKREFLLPCFHGLYL